MFGKSSDVLTKLIESMIMKLDHCIIQLGYDSISNDVRLSREDILMGLNVIHRKIIDEKVRAENESIKTDTNVRVTAIS